MAFCWSVDPYREIWNNGGFDTREAALADLHVEHPTCTRAFTAVQRPHRHGAFFSAERLVEIAADHAADEVGDVADTYPDVSEAAVAELQALIEAWAEKHMPGGPRFWTCDEEQEHRFDGVSWVEVTVDARRPVSVG